MQLAGQLIVIYVVLLWLGTAYWAFRDMQARTENPILPYFAAALIIFFTPLLFVFAVVLYLIVRPRETLAEVYERSLAEESLLAEVEKNELCPVCRDRVDADWLVCPNCRTRLHRVCPSCNRLAEPTWPLCAFCGRTSSGPARAAARARVSRRPPRSRSALVEAPLERRPSTPACAAQRTPDRAAGRGPPARKPPGALPTGPHPTAGPDDRRACRAGRAWCWSSAAALLAIGALVAAALAARRLSADRRPCRVAGGRRRGGLRRRAGLHRHAPAPRAPLPAARALPRAVGPHPARAGARRRAC